MSIRDRALSANSKHNMSNNKEPLEQRSDPSLFRPGSHAIPTNPETDIGQLNHQPSTPIGPHSSAQQSQFAQHQDRQASPSIYFHHWQPPTSNVNQATTRSGKSLVHLHFRRINFLILSQIIPCLQENIKQLDFSSQRLFQVSSLNTHLLHFRATLILFILLATTATTTTSQMGSVTSTIIHFRASALTMAYSEPTQSHYHLLVPLDINIFSTIL